MFVKMEKFPSEPYKNPKLHNFRPMISAFDHRNMLPEGFIILCFTSVLKKQGSLGIKPNRNLQRFKQVRFTPTLMLHLLTPTVSVFQRHRRRRGTYSAFLDRVEEKLSRSWKNRL
ncbi:hypothetical protein F2P81_016500 [Scophthalmus maximus]|uniref:Uncharacterized protein n=1 Tax=Scophthalmus maximus TaxID=52904 RepID=A0A6A4SH60_SCOMX|nr:hypothetical protein F2P81_016500 [Scophthalmus maximus]